MPLIRRLSGHGRRVALGVAVAASVFVGIPAPADALTVPIRTGTVGPVTVYTPIVKGTDTRSNTFPYATIRFLGTSGFTARARAASAGPQLVTAGYTVQIWNENTGAWNNYLASDTYHGTVSGGGSVRFPAWNGYATQQLQPYDHRYYRIQIGIVWTDINTGRVLGREALRASVAGETACATAFIACTTYAAYIYF